MLLDGPPDPFDRGRWGRPLIPLPGDADGEPVEFNRVSTIASHMKNDHRLGEWREMCLAAGLSRADSVDLVEQVRSIPWDARPAAKADLPPDFLNGISKPDRDRFRELLAEGRRRGFAEAKAAYGTAVHLGTDGEEHGLDDPRLPGDVEAVARFLDLHAVRDREASVANPALRIAGSTDGVVLWKGKETVFDIKTGRLNVKSHQIQLTGYASCRYWDREYGWGTSLDVDQKVGLVLHVPATTGKLRVVEVPLSMTRLRRAIAEHAVKERDLTIECDATAAMRERLAEVLVTCELGVARELYVRYRDLWTDDLTGIVKGREVVC